MQLKQKISIITLILAAILSVFLPSESLFTGDGFFAHFIRRPETMSMLLEILILFCLLGAVFLLIGNPEKKWFFALTICIGFAWCHVTFLPMLLSGIYLGYIILLGRFVRGKLIDEAVPFGFLADVILGSSLIITEYCLLSALGIGSIPVLKAISIITGVCLYGWMGRRLKKGSGSLRERLYFIFTGHALNREKTGRDKKLQGLLYCFILVMVLIQVGKMNLALDFDTLWYGVRSEYIVNNGNGIYENPGMISIAYVYSKGWEVLTLPLCDLASHSYLTFFNVWLAVLGLSAVYGISRFYMKENNALLSAALMSAVPGLMNLAVSAKTDVITWLFQLIMIFYFLCYVEREGEKPVRYLILAAGAYILSLAMKPTSLVFSTAVFGMAGLYLIFRRKLSFAAPARNWFYFIPQLAALAGIWARTMIITGMPVTSVFTSILSRLGFQMKYPFATSSLPQNWQEESNLHVLIRRLYQMLLAPEGEDMTHVAMAWGSSLMFFLAVSILVFFLNWFLCQRKKEASGITPVMIFAHVLFWPFLAVNLVSLVMLYQVDGNYFVLLYTAVAIFGSGALGQAGSQKVKRLWTALLLPILVLNIVMSAESNWAWSLGFSKIQLINKGRVNHEALQYEDMVKKGNAAIWDILAQDQRTRVIAFGNHPFCLEFPCNVQSYKDITAPWGNVELVDSAGTFKEYMKYAKTDYVYVEAGYIGESSWEWSYGLLKDMIAQGILTDLFFENGNMLAKTNLAPDTEAGRADEGKASENLRIFNENYITADMALLIEKNQ